MRFNVYDVFYSLYSQQHVSAAVAVGSHCRGGFGSLIGMATLCCDTGSRRFEGP
jgi:hypothetical protein